MKLLCSIGQVSGHLSFEDAAKASAGLLSSQSLEICMGNWSRAPHARLAILVGEQGEAGSDFLSVLERNGLSLAALNCSGNQLHPVDESGKARSFTTRFRAVELLGVNAIVLMSGLPGWRAGGR
mgnify:CR=1 FL=1